MDCGSRGRTLFYGTPLLEFVENISLSSLIIETLGLVQGSIWDGVDYFLAQVSSMSRKLKGGQIPDKDSSGHLQGLLIDVNWRWEDRERRICVRSKRKFRCLAKHFPSGHRAKPQIPSKAGECAQQLRDHQVRQLQFRPKTCLMSIAR
jgi:hypothetical protein